jgi:hypothetical protein
MQATQGYSLYPCDDQRQVPSGRTISASPEQLCIPIAATSASAGTQLPLDRALQDLCRCVRSSAPRNVRKIQRKRIHAAETTPMCGMATAECGVREHRRAGPWAVAVLSLYRAAGRYANYFAYKERSHQQLEVQRHTRLLPGHAAQKRDEQHLLSADRSGNHDLMRARVARPGIGCNCVGISVLPESFRYTCGQFTTKTDSRCTAERARRLQACSRTAAAQRSEDARKNVRCLRKEFATQAHLAARTRPHLTQEELSQRSHSGWAPEVLLQQRQQPARHSAVAWAVKPARPTIFVRGFSQRLSKQLSNLVPGAKPMFSFFGEA